MGDKVRARHIAQKVGAPLVPGTLDPVDDGDAVIALLESTGCLSRSRLHSAVAEAWKVAREMNEIPELFESATREAVAAFGRGECFVERYLDVPRHVETQCLADSHGKVVVVSTRDCPSAPSPEVGRGAGTLPPLNRPNAFYFRIQGDPRRSRLCGDGTGEFLVGQDGTTSFLGGQHLAPGRAPGV